jgi:ankyrin repeat protein
MLALLLSHGADPLVTNHNGASAFDIARNQCQQYLIEFRRNNRTEVNRRLGLFCAHLFFV